MKDTVLVLFGATGDLMRKKVLPGLYALQRDGALDSVKQIIGFSRRDYSDEDFHDYIKKQIHKKLDIEEAVCKALFEKTSFISGYFDDKEAYKKLAEQVNEYGDENTHVIFYLAVPPTYYEQIITSIPNCKQNLCSFKTSAVIEKPVGSNCEEAEKIQETLLTAFDDEQVYRVDHYLHKSIIQAIIDLRFNNKFFESSWNNQHIKKITIRTNEEFGLEERGSFYDPLGAVRDVGQNHLAMLLAIIAMDRPEDYSAESVRQARAEILSKLMPIEEGELEEKTYRAQYKGYRQIENVDPKSQTETYFKIATELDDVRWRDVQIVFEAGKKLGRVEKDIRVEMHDGNEIVFEFEGDKLGVFMSIDTAQGVQEQKLIEIDVEERFVAEYMQMLRQVMEKDLTWFVSQEEVLAAWDFFDPILKAWDENKVALREYEPSTLTPIHESSFIDHAEKRGQIGLIGLGKMGNGIARQLFENGWDVIAQNRSNDKVDEFIEFGGKGAYEVKELVEKLEGPKTIWVMVPSGKPIEHILQNEEDGLIHLLNEGDTVIEAGNSNWKETIRRAKLFEEKGINFIDAGVSGGPSGARNGACIMIGGNKESFKQTRQIFKNVSLPGGYKFFEGHGAGHFVKMVHNGIEYGMMQAIGEGFEVMKESEFDLNLTDVTEVYNRGSVIESRLINWLYDAYILYSENLDPISGEVSHSGEGLWTVETAKEMGIPVRVIEDALQFRVDSEGNPSYTGQVVSALRGQFGGHPVKKETSKK